MISTNPDIRTEKHPTGIYERLFCECCEKKIGVWESYARTALDGKIGIRNGRFIYINGIDYRKFKLFQLSLLFRAHVSQRKEFSAVDLGDSAEPLRLMLLNENPGRPYEFGCMVTFDPNMPEPEILTDMIFPPDKIILPGDYETYNCYLKGLYFRFFVSDHNKDIPAQGAFLQKDGTLPLFIDHRGTLSLCKFMNEAAEARKERGEI